MVRSAKLAKQFPERKSAVVNYPVIKGLGNSLALNKIRSAIRLKNIFDTSLAEYKEDAWLTSFDYTVNYNKNFILDLTFKQEGVGAYPDEQTKHFAFNLNSGEIIKAKDVFKQTSLELLAGIVNDKLQAEVRRIIKESEQSSEFSAEEKKQLPEEFKGVKFEVNNLDDFSVGDKGITFLYDAGFPHAIKAIQPEGRYLFSYAELAPHIKQSGLLAKFVK
ncbi:MAG: hypothetical protein ABR577_10255 [Pyrinomonadaceae bacterium]